MTEKFEIPEDMLDFSVCVSCGYQGGCCCEPESCPDCDDGTVITCWGDLCRNGGRCIHGDGEYTCELSNKRHPRALSECGKQRGSLP